MTLALDRPATRSHDPATASGPGPAPPSDPQTARPADATSFANAAS